MNGRIGNGLGDYAKARDNVIASEALQTDWETPATINDTWRFTSDDENWKPPTVLIRKLVDIASKGGNDLLNVGPTAERVIPQPSIDGRTTARGDLTCLHVFDWPPGGVVKVPSLGRPVRSAHLIRDGSAIPVQMRRFQVVAHGGHGVAQGGETRWRVFKVSVLGPGADHGRPPTGRRGGGGIQRQRVRCVRSETPPPRRAWPGGRVGRRAARRERHRMSTGGRVLERAAALALKFASSRRGKKLAPCSPRAVTSVRRRPPSQPLQMWRRGRQTARAC